MVRARNILTTEQLAALGEIAVESAQLENTVELMIQVVLKIGPEEFEELIKGRMLGAKVDVLKVCGQAKLAGKKQKKRRGRFTAIIDHIKFLISQRAIAIHGLWGPEGGKLGDLIAMMSGQWEPGTAEAKHKKGAMKSAQVQKLADEFHQANSDLWKLIRDIWIFKDTQRKA